MSHFVRFVGGLFTASLLLAQNFPVTVSIDAAQNQRVISPNIYGVAFGDTNSLLDMNLPLNRYGGNLTSRYNWQLNANNHDSDYYFESIAETSSTPGEIGDTFIATSKAANAEPLITIPMLGWVAKLGPDRGKLAGFSVMKYGPQTSVDPYFPDAGNGILTNGQNVTGNDPNDADVPADPTFQSGWVQHLVQNGGVRYYILDNEHSLWQFTHRDVHPNGPTMDEIFGKMRDYSAMIKSIDPNALVVGPEEWGWNGYFFSGADQLYQSNTHDYGHGPDRTAHGNMDYMPWLLQQLSQITVANGLQPLDIFSLHFYPQGTGLTASDPADITPATQLLRNRSTRALWDPNYVDESWISSTVMLIPRMRSWVNTYYHAGTPIALTEYDWGAQSYMSGATAQADVLGIFGREGLDVATHWTSPSPGTPVYNAFKMYRNYDGKKSTFGDLSVLTNVPNPDNLSAFSALRSSDGALTIMVINKDPSNSTPVNIQLANAATSGTVQAYQLTASTNGIARIGDIQPAGAGIALNAPAQSVTLLVSPNAAAPQGPRINTGGIVNAASYSSAGVSPGELLTIFGTNLGPGTLETLTLTADSRLNSTLAGTQVLFDGRPAPMIYTFQTQVSAVAPFEIFGQPTTAVQISYNGILSNAVTVPVVAAAPGIFSSNSQGTGQGAILNQDNSRNSAAAPAHAGDVIQVFATGQGVNDPGEIDGKLASGAQALATMVTATIGGIPAAVQYAGAAPQLVNGMFQVNITVPSGLTAGNQPVLISVGGAPNAATTQTGITVAVQ